MLPRPQTLVPKEGNPNVLHVYEPMDFSNAIRAAVTPSYRPSLGGMDSEDTPTGFAPPSSTSAASDGESYGKRAKNDVFPATSGVFIPDADTGTPLDPFSMDALVRYTQRHLALMHEPVVKFAASIAQKIGKNPDSMLVNGGNLLDPKAPSVQAMFTGSPLSQAATAQAIAKAVVDLLSAAAAAQGQGNVASEPVKLERLPKTMKTENPIQAALGMVYERIGPRGIFQRGPIRGANDPSTPATSILSQLAVFLAGLHEENSTARWMWNSLPENAGIAVIRSDVVAAMEDCHAMIRDSIPDVQMWHLITGEASSSLVVSALRLLSQQDPMSVDHSPSW